MALSIPAGAALAQEQEGDAWIEEPTRGVNLPLVPLAGEHDALAVSANPAGLALLRSGHLAAALDLADAEAAAGAGQGFGAFWGTSYGGNLVPRLGIGLGVETLRPPGDILADDPGDATRLSFAKGLALGDSLAVGAAYRRFFGDGLVGGAGTWDLGVSSRWGPRVAVGLALRDLTAPDVQDVSVQRRYELDLALRPDGTERLELGAGGRIGEREGDLDGWLRAGVRLRPGVYLRGEYLTRELRDAGANAVRDHRLTAGVELSFGRRGAALYGAGSVRSGEARGVGGTLVARASGERVPSALGEPARVHRVTLSGDGGDRGHGRKIAELRRIARDPAVKAVIVDIEGHDGSFATAQELRESIAALSAADIPVFSYLVNATMIDYFIATGADQVLVDPAGGLRMAGIAGTRLYYGDLFDKIGVRAQFERVAEYKSAPEAFTRDGPTPEASEVRTRLFDSIYAQVEGSIASSRDISRTRARELIAGGPYTPGQLEDMPELVDEVVVGDDVEDTVATALGARYRERSRPQMRPERWSHPQIAVIYLTGDIVSGESRRIPLLGQELVGDETITEAIAAARRDPRVGAIVLRIDSPGGSALASEKIAREVFKTRGRKPIVCSMGDVAASGGYFAAAGCERIFAEPTTITGSIGIFTGKVDFSGLLSRVGLTWSTEKRGDRADMNSSYRPFTDEEREIVREHLDYYYERFTSTVERGRNLSPDEVDEVARGRVFTGADAAEVGLVDELGGLGRAIAEARRRAGIGRDVPVRVVELPELRLGLVGQLFSPVRAEREGALRDLPLPPGVRELARSVPGSLWAEPGAVQARLPFSIDWAE